MDKGQKELTQIYTRHKGIEAFQSVWAGGSRTIFLKGLVGSAATLFLAALNTRRADWQAGIWLAVLNDPEDAGYFYHDLV